MASDALVASQSSKTNDLSMRLENGDLGFQRINLGLLFFDRSGQDRNKTFHIYSVRIGRPRWDENGFRNNFLDFLSCKPNFILTNRQIDRLAKFSLFRTAPLEANGI